MFKHLLRIIWNERRQNIGLFVELIIIIVCFWFLIDKNYNQVKSSLQPTGFDIEHVYQIYHMKLDPKASRYVDPESEDYLVYSEALLKLRERFEQMPEIEAASLSFNSLPHMGNNSTSTLFADSTLGVKTVMRRVVMPSYYDVFNIHYVDNRPESLSEAVRRDNLVVFPINIMKKLFPDAKTYEGKRVYLNEDLDEEYALEVGAVCQRLEQNTYWMWDKSYILPCQDKDILALGDKDFNQFIELAIRVKPEADHNFKEYFFKEIIPNMQVGNVILTDIRSIEENKEFMDLETNNTLTKELLLLIFFGINVLLGVVGIFWHRTSQRIHEMGVRISIGDTPKGIMKRYLTEGLLITLGTLPFTIGLFVLIWKKGLTSYYWMMDAPRFLFGMGLAYISILLMVFLGIWIPARRSTKVPPTVALKDE